MRARGGVAELPHVRVGRNALGSLLNSRGTQQHNSKLPLAEPSSPDCAAERSSSKQQRAISEERTIRSNFRFLHFPNTGCGEKRNTPKTLTFTRGSRPCFYSNELRRPFMMCVRCQMFASSSSPPLSFSWASSSTLAGCARCTQQRCVCACVKQVDNGPVSR